MVACSFDYRLDPDRRDNRFGWVVGGCSLYIYTFLMQANQRQKELETIVVLMLALVAAFHFTHRDSLIGGAFVLGTLALLWPLFARVVHLSWQKLGHVMGFIMNRVILTVLFYAIVWPLGLIARKTRKSGIDLDDTKVSLYKQRDHLYVPGDLENPW